MTTEKAQKRFNWTVREPYGLALMQFEMLLKQNPKVKGRITKQRILETMIEVVSNDTAMQGKVARAISKTA